MKTHGSRCSATICNWRRIPMRVPGRAFHFSSPRCMSIVKVVELITYLSLHATSAINGIRLTRCAWAGGSWPPLASQHRFCSNVLCNKNCPNCQCSLASSFRISTGRAVCHLRDYCWSTYPWIAPGLSSNHSPISLSTPLSEWSLTRCEGLQF